jgi:predicted lipoprotein with Yx(FWY)xxD motif
VLLPRWALQQWELPPERSSHTKERPARRPRRRTIRPPPSRSVLYVFKPDNASTVSCTFGCAAIWPPLSVVDNASTAAGDGVDAALLGKLPNSAGDHVVTYNGWPLYRYAADKAPGQHRGQDVFLNGGYWYVMKPDGKPPMP